MSSIHLTTHIYAPIELVFDLSRSIDFHMISTPGSDEVAVGGRTTGLIELDETVTWEAKHLGVRQTLTSIITGFERPTYFADEQFKGIFKNFHHQHFFEQKEDHVLLTDTFDFESPGWIIGKFFNWIYLKGYLEGFLVRRNAILKEWAESPDQPWKELPGMEIHLPQPSIS